MGLTYKLGGGQGIIPGGPKKIKKAKQKTAEDVGREGREARKKKYDTPKERKKVSTLMEINTKSQKAIDEGLPMNKYGLPLGDQESKEGRPKKFNLFRRVKAKFEKNSK